MALLAADFLALLRRTTDTAWLEGMIASPDGSAVLDALFAIANAVDVSVEEGCDTGLAITAPGGTQGAMVLTLTRTVPAGSATIPKGYLFKTTGGIQLGLVLDVVVAANQATIVLPLVTLRSSEVVNTGVDGAFDDFAVGATADGLVDPNSPEVLDSGGFRIIGPPGSVSVTPPFLKFSASTPILGGASDWLSAHGDERGQRRQSGEATDAYRRRVTNIPEAVSPLGVADGVQGAASAVNLPIPAILEPFEDQASPALKANLGLSTFGGVYATGVEGDSPPGRPFGARDRSADSPEKDFLDDAGTDFDDPGDLPRELVGLRESRAYFRIAVPGPIVDPDNSRMFYSGTENPVSPAGRPPGARDAAATSPARDFWDDPVYGYPDVQDHPQVIGALMSVWEEANRKKAAGVQFDLYLNLITLEIGVGSSLLAAETVVFNLVPPAGKAWWLRDAKADHSSLDLLGLTPVDPASMWHRVQFTFEDGTIFITPAFRNVWSERLDETALLAMGYPFKRITAIDGMARSNGIDPITVVGTFFMLEASTV